MSPYSTIFEHSLVRDKNIDYLSVYCTDIVKREARDELEIICWCYAVFCNESSAD